MYPLQRPQHLHPPAASDVDMTDAAQTAIRLAPQLLANLALPPYSILEPVLSLSEIHHSFHRLSLGVDDKRAVLDGISDEISVIPRVRGSAGSPGRLLGQAVPLQSGRIGFRPPPNRRAWSAARRPDRLGKRGPGCGTWRVSLPRRRLEALHQSLRYQLASSSD